MRDSVAKKDFSDIPQDADIVMTHSPPTGYRGKKHLHQMIKKIQPKVHVFGHEHDDYGYNHDSTTTYINAAITISKRKKTVRNPIVFDILVSKEMITRR
jgi:Icc-related predicted phosphoesterase